MHDVASQVVGRKDMTSNIFDIWREIFQKRIPKAVIVPNEGVKAFQNKKQENKELVRLHDLIANHGDFDLTIEGIHENLLHLRYNDSSLQKTVNCLELLGDAEIISHYIRRSQHFVLNCYVPSKALAVRHVVAQPERPHIQWPRTMQRHKSDLSGKKELLNSWMGSLQPTICQSISVGSLILDVISSLLYILSPQTLRTVAPQLLSQGEKDEIAQLVDTMIGYGLTYKQKKNNLSGDNKDLNMEPHGPFLDPAIYTLVKFKEYVSGHRLLSLSLRQMLNHEIEVEKIRRESLARNARAMIVAAELNALTISEQQSADAKVNGKGFEGEAFTAPGKNAGNLSRLPVSREKLMQLNGKGDVRQSHAVNNSDIACTKNQLKPKKQQTTNFFDRFLSVSQREKKVNDDPKMQNSTNQRDSRPVLYKFHEGFTNAIRRPVLIQEFL